MKIYTLILLGVLSLSVDASKACYEEKEKHQKPSKKSQVSLSVYTGPTSKPIDIPVVKKTAESFQSDFPSIRRKKDPSVEKKSKTTKERSSNPRPRRVVSPTRQPHTPVD